MEAGIENYALLLRSEELCREIAEALPTPDVLALCERTALEFEKLATAASPYAVEPLLGQVEEAVKQLAPHA